jgi:predicted dithiol-disulfide oxidoreductase (DUF899 family)
MGDVPVLDLPMGEEDRRHREQLLVAERELRDQRERVAELRRALPPGPVIEVEYRLREGDSDLTVDSPGTDRDTRLAELFAPGQDQLVIYHMMFAPDWDQGCRMCSMWLDGLDGVAHHIGETASFAVVAKAELARLRAWARHRGWSRLRLLSSHGTTFNRDFGVEDTAGEQLAGVSVLTRDPADGTIRRCYAGSPYHGHGEYRGIDLLCPVWHVLDLLPSGRGDWMPSDGH